MRFAMRFRRATRTSGSTWRWGGSPWPSFAIRRWREAISDMRSSWASVRYRGILRAGCRRNGRPIGRFIEAIDGLVECLEALGRQRDCAGFARCAIGFREARTREVSDSRRIRQIRGCDRMRVVGMPGFFDFNEFFGLAGIQAIGIERPQNGTNEPKKSPGTDVACSCVDGKEADRR